MAMTTPLKIGFIGGSLDSAVGYTHYSASHLDGFFQLEAGCFSRNSELNIATGNRYSIDSSRIYSTWQELVERERERLDAVVVLTPTPSHAEIVKAVLRAELPVICEKALATSSIECAEIDRYVEKHKGFLAMTYNYSGYPMFRELAALCHLGKLGQLHQIQVEMPQESFIRRIDKQWPTPQEWRCIDYEVPTISLDLGVHLHHLVDIISGGLKPIKIVATEGRTGYVADVIDNINALSMYQDSLVVNAWYGKTALGLRNGLRLRVYGSEGSGEWLQCEPEKLVVADSNGAISVLGPGSPQLHEANKERYQRFKPGHPCGFIEAFANLYADIASALLIRKGIGEGPTGPVLGARHAFEGLQWLEAMHEAAQTESWVTMGCTR